MNDKALNEAIANTVGLLDKMVEDMNARHAQSVAECEQTKRRAVELLKRIFAKFDGK